MSKHIWVPKTKGSKSFWIKSGGRKIGSLKIGIKIVMVESKFVSQKLWFLVIFIIESNTNSFSNLIIDLI